MEVKVDKASINWGLEEIESAAKGSTELQSDSDDETDGESDAWMVSPLSNLSCGTVRWCHLSCKHDLYTHSLSFLPSPPNLASSDYVVKFPVIEVCSWPLHAQSNKYFITFVAAAKSCDLDWLVRLLALMGDDNKVFPNPN